MNTTKGFTLVELMVSVFIVVLLTGIVVSNLASSKSRSRDAKRISDIAQLQLAFELYFDRCSQYPRVDTSGFLQAQTTGLPTDFLNRSNGCPTGVNLGTFLGTLPTTPSGTGYAYAINDGATPTDYVLRAVLENKNQVLTDAPTGLYMNNAIDCTHTTTWNYCVQPR